MFPDEIDDLKSYRLARDIKTQIEDELQYPGHIKVTVVRETRAVEYFNRSKFWVCFSSVKIQLLIDNNKVGEMLSLKE